MRRKDAEEYLSTLPGVTVALGDALDESAVQSCMEGLLSSSLKEINIILSLSLFFK